MDARQIGKQMGSADDSAGVRLLSVGHSNHDWPSFLTLLKQSGVTTLADVRSSPFSRRHPHFNKPALEHALREHGIAYVFLGDRLGGRPSSPALYDDEGRVDYERVRRSEAFQHGLEQLAHGRPGSIIAFLCSEEDPLDCHRGLMIAPALAARGLAPQHLRKDGSVETNEEMETRLLQETGIGAGLVDGLFAAMLTDEDRRALLAEAYRRMARGKAYRRPDEGDTE
jgi:uncharacterized protein (DUF488 family)